MEILISLLIGVLFAGGIYCLLRRSIVKLVIGLLLLSQGANLLVFGSGGLTKDGPPLIPAEEKTLKEEAADPLPQALVLTAIVIGFGLVTFTLSLVHQAYQALGSDDIAAFRETDRLSH